jgi:hypothetical protein
MNAPVWILMEGGANADYAVYGCRVNLSETGLSPQLPVASGPWRVAVLWVIPENAWTTAVVELKQQGDMSRRYSLVPKATITASQSPPCTNQIDVTAIAYLNAEITTGEASDAFAEFRLCLAK